MFVEFEIKKNSKKILKGFEIKNYVLDENEATFESNNANLIFNCKGIFYTESNGLKYNLNSFGIDRNGKAQYFFSDEYKHFYENFSKNKI